VQFFLTAHLSPSPFRVICYIFQELKLFVIFFCAQKTLLFGCFHPVPVSEHFKTDTVLHLGVPYLKTFLYLLGEKWTVLMDFVNLISVNNISLNTYKCIHFTPQIIALTWGNNGAHFPPIYILPRISFCYWVEISNTLVDFAAPPPSPNGISQVAPMGTEKAVGSLLRYVKCCFFVSLSNGFEDLAVKKVQYNTRV
jgi:hypothetical protein